MFTSCPSTNSYTFLNILTTISPIISLITQLFMHVYFCFKILLGSFQISNVFFMYFYFLYRDLLSTANSFRSAFCPLMMLSMKWKETWKNSYNQVCRRYHMFLRFENNNLFEGIISLNEDGFQLDLFQSTL